MKTEGWIFLIISWGLILSVSSYCLWQISSKRHPK
jgi:hypothetical protein